MQPASSTNSKFEKNIAKNIYLTTHSSCYCYNFLANKPDTSKPTTADATSPVLTTTTNASLSTGVLSLFIKK